MMPASPKPGVSIPPPRDFTLHGAPGSKPPAVSSEKRKAFSLVELLVVIGIIALLIAILMPALAAARRQAQMTKCAANLRTLGQAMYLHANDHHGYFPLQGDALVSMQASGDGDPTYQRYIYFNNNGAAAPNERVTALPHALALYLGYAQLKDTSYTGIENVMAVSPILDHFLCPSDLVMAQTAAATPSPGDTAPRWIYDNSAYLTGYSSYLYNEEVLGFQNNIGSPPHTRLRGYYSAVPNPSGTMLMCDGHYWHQSQHQTFDGYGINITTAPATLADFFNKGTCEQEAFDVVRHHGSMNILYVDGHVDSQPILADNNSNYTFVDPTVGSMFFPNGATNERPSGYIGGSVTGWAAPFAASNVISGGTLSGSGLSGVSLDVGFQ
jgi:prepilin-type N-terminal cleavage/methylation domain-containing protein/prepilin-type processing-associated H-X9-DG protein